MIHRLREVIRIGDVLVRVERGTCNQCFFYDENVVERCKNCADLDCSRFNRPDKKDIIYKKVKEGD